MFYPLSHAGEDSTLYSLQVCYQVQSILRGGEMYSHHRIIGNKEYRRICGHNENSLSLRNSSCGLLV